MEETLLSFADLPLPWKPISDEQADAEIQEAWAYWRRMYPDMAATVVQELQREMTEAHPLFKVECHLAAWDSFGRKNFAFLTNKASAAVAVVHLSFYKETEAWIPAT